MALKTFSQLEVESSLCLWEAMIEQRVEQEKEAADRGDDVGTPFMRYWDRSGTAAMRHHAIYLGQFVCDVTALIPDDARDCLPFDWEIVPAILKAIQWDERGYTTGKVVEVAGVVTAALRAIRAEDDAAALSKKGEAA